MALHTVQPVIIDYLSSHVGKLVTLAELIDETGLTKGQIIQGMWRIANLRRWPIATVAGGQVWRIYDRFEDLPRPSGGVPLPVGPTLGEFIAEPPQPAETPTAAPKTNGRIYEHIGDLTDGRVLLRGDDAKTYVAEIKEI